MSIKRILAYLSDNFRDILQRPLAIFAIAFYIFCAVFVRNPSVNYNIVLLITAAVAVVLFLSFLKFGRAARAAFVLSFALCMASVFSFLIYEVRRSEVDSLVGERLIIAEVTDVQRVGDEWFSYLACAEISGKDVCILFGHNSRMLEGEVFRCYADLAPLGEEAFGQRAMGAELQAQIKCEIEMLGASDRGVLGVFSDINHTLSSLFYARLGRDAGGFAASVLLGNRDNLPVPLYHALKGMGISHLIALSGLHLSIICSIAELFTRRLGRKASRLIAIPISVFYMFVTGFSPSIVRSGVMLIVLSIIRLSKRRGDGITAVGITLMGVTLVSPYAACDLGFQLSAAATLGVYAAGRFMNDPRRWEADESEIKKRIKAALMPFVIGAFACLFTILPLILYYDTVTFVGIIMTVPFSLFLTLIMWLLPLVLILPFPVFHALVGVLIEVFEGTALYFASVSQNGLVIKDQILSFAVICLFLAVVALFLSAERGRLRLILSVAATAVLAVFIVMNLCLDTYKHTADIIPIKTEGGDVIVIRCADEVVVCDMTDGSANSVDVAISAIHILGKTEIDTLIMCEPTAEHFEMLFSDGALYGLDRIYITGEDTDYDYIERLSEHTKILTLRYGDIIEFGESRFGWYDGEFELVFGEDCFSYSSEVIMPYCEVIQMIK